LLFLLTESEDWEDVDVVAQSKEFNAPAVEELGEEAPAAE
jgi:hypothetical protein